MLQQLITRFLIKVPENFVGKCTFPGSAGRGGVKIGSVSTIVRALGLSRMLVFACVVGLTGLRAADRWATLEAIHQLENPRNVSRPGPHGELGAYQFRSATWRMHTSLPFHHALDRRVADVIAVKHYEWLKRGIEAAGMAATPYMIALAWNGGLSGAVSGRAPAAAHDYAARAANLAGALNANVVAQAQ